MYFVVYFGLQRGFVFCRGRTSSQRKVFRRGLETLVVKFSRRRVLKEVLRREALEGHGRQKHALARRPSRVPYKPLTPYVNLPEKQLHCDFSKASLERLRCDILECRERAFDNKGGSFSH